MGGLFMGLIGCGHIIASKTMEAAACVICLMGNLYSGFDDISRTALPGDVAWRIALDPLNRVALAVGIVIGVNYMNLVNMYRRYRRKKHGRNK